MRRLLQVLLAIAALPAAADEVQVVSPRPDSVSVTIYRDLFALVTETRTVDLPAGPVTLVFDGVVDTLLPQSAVVSDANRAVDESNYDFERLTPANLLKKSIGREVTLWRTNPATGRARQVVATIVSANTNGVVFRTADGAEALHCSGLPERLDFQEIPGDLKREPQLSIRLAAGTAGKRQVRVSYLAHGFGWQANYVATLGQRMDLLGWITLNNFTGASFRNASVQVVAGKLNLLDEDDGGTSVFGATANYGGGDELEGMRDDRIEEMQDEIDKAPDDVEYFSGCYPMGSRKEIRREAVPIIDSDSYLRESLQPMQGEELEEVVVTGYRASMAVRENLADYQMYRLPEPTDLQARQTKQVAFLHKADVRYDRFYSVRLTQLGDIERHDEDPLTPSAMVGWTNRESDGLGEPLPGGRVRFFEPGATGLVFIGEDRIADKAVGTPVELTCGIATDLDFSVDGPGSIDDMEFSTGAMIMALITRRAYLPVNLRVTSAKPAPVTFEVRQAPLEDMADFRVKGASLPTQRKAGDWMWRFTVPAHGEATLSYKMGGKARED